jgi:thiol-disulfide isomerase/thioredoxin
MRWAIAAALLAALSLARPAYAADGAEPTLEVVLPETYAPKVVAAHAGRPLLVNFWATWCDPCRAEMPALIAATRGAAVDVVLVSLDPAKELPAVRAFLRSVAAKGALFIVAPGDPEIFIDKVDATWDGTVPYTLLYERNGKIVQRLKGEQQRADFARALAKLTAAAK